MLLAAFNTLAALMHLVLKWESDTTFFQAKKSILQLFFPALKISAIWTGFPGLILVQRQGLNNLSVEQNITRFPKMPQAFDMGRTIAAEVTPPHPQADGTLCLSAFFTHIQSHPGLLPLIICTWFLPIFYQPKADGFPFIFFTGYSRQDD